MRWSEKWNEWNKMIRCYSLKIVSFLCLRIIKNYVTGFFEIFTMNIPSTIKMYFQHGFKFPIFPNSRFPISITIVLMTVSGSNWFNRWLFLSKLDPFVLKLLNTFVWYGAGKDKKKVSDDPFRRMRNNGRIIILTGYTINFQLIGMDHLLTYEDFIRVRNSKYGTYSTIGHFLLFGDIINRKCRLIFRTFIG